MSGLRLINGSVANLPMLPPENGLRSQRDDKQGTKKIIGEDTCVGVLSNPEYALSPIGGVCHSALCKGSPEKQSYRTPVLNVWNRAFTDLCVTFDGIHSRLPCSTAFESS